MISVKFYTFSKRVNSTKLPSGGTTINCDLREPTSIINPIITIKVASKPTGYNYAYISEFGRYYFVNDWVSEYGRWTAHLKVDVLGSYSATIKASSQYVVRSASKYNEYIQDKLFPATTDVTFKVASYSGTQLLDTTNISFVVGIIGNTGATGMVGPVTYYSMDTNDLNNLLTYISSSYSIWSGINNSDIAEATQKALLNPFQYIVSCHALPIAKQSDNAVSSIKFGPYTYPTTAYVIPKNTTVARSMLFTVDAHPMASSYGKFLNTSPFSEYSLYVGTHGRIPVDGSSFVDSNSLNATIVFDLISGDATLQLAPGNDAKRMVYYPAHVGVEIPISAMNVNPLKSMNDNIKVVSDNLTSVMTPTAKIATGMGDSMLNYIQSKMPQVSVSGTQGSFAAWYFPCALYEKYYNIANPDNFHFGRPLCSIETLSTLSGYTMIDNPAIEISGTEEEQDRILNYMQSGFFLE